MLGRFAIIEGIDGTGKTTQQDMLAAHISGSGKKVITINSPSEWYRQQPGVAEFIDKGVRKIGANTLAVLAAADRMLATDNIISPAIQAGTDVVAARYTFSAVAYSRQRGADLDFVRTINAKTAKPTHGLLLQIDPELVIDRISQRGQEQTFEENADYLRSVQACMMEEWPSDFLIMDATLPKEEILGRMAWYMDKYSE